MSHLTTTPDPAPAERRQMERALRESEARLRSVLDSAPMVLWALDREGVFTFSEGRGLHALGLVPGEIVGRSAFEVYADLPQILEDCRRGLAGEEFTTTVEIGGVTFESRYSTLRDEDGAIAGVIGVAIDITERKRAATELEHSLSLLRATLESTADGILVVDTAGKIVSFNGRFAQLWGIPQAVLDSGDDDRAIAAVLDQLQDPAGFLDKVRDLYGHPEAESRDVLTFKDGRTFERVSHPQRVGTRVVGRVWSFRDVTDRNNAEAALQQAYDELEQRVRERTAELAEMNAALQDEITERERAEEELRHKSSELEAIFQALPDLYFRVDAAERIIDCRAGKSFEFLRPPEQLIGCTVEDMLPPDQASRIQDRLREVGTTGELVCLEYTHPDPAGDRELEARLLPFLDGQVISVVRDITDQKKAERDLRRSEEHFRLLIENSSDVASIIDVDGVNRYQSPSSERVLGYTPEEMMGTSAFGRIHPEDAPAAREVLEEIARNPGTTRTTEFRYRHKDGSWCTLEVSGRTLLPDSAEGGVIINSRDVSERGMAAEALRRAKEEAERANRAKSEFLSRMSHELRTPMNSILGFAQLLAKRELPADQRKAVDHILKAGRHLLNLINEVLDIARIESNRQPLSLEPVQVHATVQEALSLVRPMAEQRDILIDDLAFGCEYYVRADGQRLMQVLLNLLSNAIKYNRPAGTVRLTCQRIPGDDADDGTAKGRMRIEIHDTGRGIPAERMAELFIPFSRLGAEQSDQEGTGLGLALSQRLVEAMGGQLLVESRVDVGSTFTVELDIVDSPLVELTRAPRSRATVTGETATERPATLLYIEDNLANLSLIQTIFATRPEITLVPALQGRLGLDLAWEHNPDLILLDLHLPDITGDEVLRRLRADARTHTTPIIIISADATPGRVQDLVAAGAHAYLTKPLDIDQFLDAVNHVLARRQV